MGDGNERSLLPEASASQLMSRGEIELDVQCPEIEWKLTALYWLYSQIVKSSKPARNQFADSFISAADILISLLIA